MGPSRLLRSLCLALRPRIHGIGDPVSHLVRKVANVMPVQLRNDRVFGCGGREVTFAFGYVQVGPKLVRDVQ